MTLNSNIHPRTRWYDLTDINSETSMTQLQTAYRHNLKKSHNRIELPTLVDISFGIVTTGNKLDKLKVLRNPTLLTFVEFNIHIFICFISAIYVIYRTLYYEKKVYLVFVWIYQF